MPHYPETRGASLTRRVDISAKVTTRVPSALSAPRREILRHQDVPPRWREVTVDVIQPQLDIAARIFTTEDVWRQLPQRRRIESGHRRVHRRLQPHREAIQMAQARGQRGSIAKYYR